MSIKDNTSADKLSDEFKPPKKKTQTLIDFKKARLHEVEQGSAQPNKRHKSSCPEGDIRDMLERVIVRQDRAQECIERLLVLFLREEPVDLSDDDVPVTKSKK